MRRRQLLAAVPLALAGCSAPTPDGGTGTDEPTTTQPPGSWSIDLQMRGRDCASGQEGTASVSFDADTVTIDGTIIGADMCHVARLDTVSYDGETGEFEVLVESVRDADDDTACAQCLTAIEYAIVARFTGPLPDRVSVRHRTSTGVTQIATADR